MRSNDSWSFLSLGGGQIKTSAGQDGEVIATGGSSAVGIETLTYTADATRQLESIGEVWEHFSNENRNARFSKTIVTTTAFDPNNPDAVESSPMIFGDDRVVVTGTQSFLTVRKMALGPRPEDVFREYIQSIFDLGTGERKGRDNLTNYTAGLRESGGMAPGGDPTPRDQWITTYEANWDPRNFYEADLDGIPLPADRYLHLDAHLYKLPDGFVAPSSNTSGRTWTEWFAGRKGDAFDQSINGISGVAAGFDGGLSTFIRKNINPFGDYVDYESPMYVGGEIAGTIGSALVNPTGIAAKGTAIYNLYNKYDDAGRCANLATKVIHGGCFIEGTLVTVSSLPGQSTSTDSLWSNPSWLDEPSQETPWLAPERYASVATRTELQVPIESVPIGARVPTKNPNRFEVDPQPEPDHATWAKVSITVERSDGGIVDAQIIRPRSWILESGLCAGRMLPLNLPELEVSGLALVTAIDDCPPIADGEGSVVTARFVTREVHVVASVDVLGADGTVETITGTTIHPVWSVDRQSWVPLAELADGETLQGLDGLAVVLGVSLSRVSQPVYNIEVHGEHVYQVGELGLVVHNTCEGIYVFMTTTGKTYVGQSVDVARRLAEHVNAGRLASAATATIINVTGGKMSREIAEQMLINSLGGLPSTVLANRVNPIGFSRAAEILAQTGIKLRP
jgi:hypothetical protein